MIAGCGSSEAGESADETMQASGSDAITALSLMQEVNTKEAVPAEDNYRTWYEVFVYSFYDSDGDGIGDLRGLTEKLDYINDGDAATDTDLGCDGIWLMPVMPATTYHKYDVTDYCAIDSEYGTMEDFEVFVEECHARGVNIIIDLVMNHSSSQNPWFLEAAEYLKSLPEGVEPDLNLGSEAVREEFAQITAFWLEKGVDGFRLDAAKEYYSGSTDANVEVLTWFNDMVKAQNQDAYIVAEVWSDMNTYAKYYESGIDSCFNFAFAEQGGIIANVAKGKSGADFYGRSLKELQETLGMYSDSYIDAPFYTNHDMGRGAGYYSGDYSERQTKLAQAMNLLMSGNSFLYYGEELGMKDSGKDENKRAPMYWSTDAEATGMCDEPADMDEVKMKYESFAEQQADGDSIYNFVKETIHVRNSYPEITHGEVVFDETYSDENICVIHKSYKGGEVLLVFNTSAEAQEVDLRGIALGEKLGDKLEIGSLLITEASDTAAMTGGTLHMPAYSVVALE